MKILETKEDNNFGTLYRFEHLNESPKGINGKLFLKFNSSFNFDKMDTEICLALSKTDLTKYPIVTGVMPPKLKYGKFENEVMWDFDGDREIFNSLNSRWGLPLPIRTSPNQKQYLDDDGSIPASLQNNE